MSDYDFYLSDSFEILLKFLFGQRNYHQDAGFKTFSEWKKRIIKIIDSINNSIINTIEITDKSHKNNLLLICKNTKNQIIEANNFNTLNENTILGLIKIIFELLGGRPDHYSLDKVNNSNHWRLNTQRQLMYYQNNEHKVRLIIDNAPPIAQNNENEYNNKLLNEKLYYDFKGNHGKFLDWYKEKYHEKYYELF